MTKLELKRIRGIADYQFGPGSGEALFPKVITIERSKRTGKIRFVKKNERLIAALRPTDSMFTLSIYGAERLISGSCASGYIVIVLDDVAEVIAEGKNVFAKHVVDAGGEMRPGDEVIILDSKKRVLAVGRALLSREEMLAFSVGVAVRIRRGRRE
jgi:uncharacterized protein with predicted RNA binding PUA domain